MSIYKMKLHESLTLRGMDIQVLRVPGGWIYTAYHPYEVVNIHGQSNTEYRASTTFVPMTKEGIEHE